MFCYLIFLALPKTCGGDQSAKIRAAGRREEQGIAEHFNIYNCKAHIAALLLLLLLLLSLKVLLNGHGSGHVAFSVSVYFIMFWVALLLSHCVMTRKTGSTLHSKRTIKTATSQ